MKAQKHSSKKLSSAAIEGTIYYSIVYSTLPSLSNIFKNIRRIYSSELFHLVLVIFLRKIKK